MSDELGLTEGWKYSVLTDDIRSEGIFRGYAMIGTESAIVIQLDDGTMRMIPAASIFYIDLIGTGKRAEEKKHAYYG